MSQFSASSLIARLQMVANGATPPTTDVDATCAPASRIDLRRRHHAHAVAARTAPAAAAAAAPHLWRQHAVASKRMYNDERERPSLRSRLLQRVLPSARLPGICLPRGRGLVPGLGRGRSRRWPPESCLGESCLVERPWAPRDEQPRLISPVCREQSDSGMTKLPLLHAIAQLNHDGAR